MECGSFGISFSYPCSHLQHGGLIFFRSLFSRWVQKFYHSRHLVLCVHTLPQHQWIARLNYPSHVRNMVLWVCWQIKRSSLCPEVGDVLEQLNPAIFERIPLCFLYLFSPDLTDWFCREWCSCCTCTAWQKHPPDLSISGFLYCPISCTSSMLPHLSYLEKSASVVFIMYYFCHFIIVGPKMSHGALCSTVFDEFRNTKLL